ncbi:MAG TPA: fluoride efflux transporter CrcB [Methylomirabilota bacterium]
MSLLLIAAGGALGAVARYGLAGLVHRVASPWFPWGTFAVNLVGCAAFGLLAGVAEARGSLEPGARAFLLVGLLGGFTTFSSFAFETFELVRAGQIPAAIGNAAGQVVLGLVSFWAAWSVARLALGTRL